ncbi:Kinesin-like protein KIF15 [Dictyocoela muelleri]|nr:Kinesin-like protein KIF15 [Dictyocoela muelleri]
MSEQAIQVFLRLKPSQTSLQITENTIKIKQKSFSVDKILTGNQQSIFLEVAKEQVLNSFKGLNSTIFAYGQTGSGKTYTIQGNDHNKGIIPRVFHFIFQCTNNFSLKISLVEIYNESVYDLFDKKRVLEIREDIDNGMFLENLTMKEIKSYEEAVMMYDEGIKYRTIDETSMNKESSRSHAILTIWYESNNGMVRKKSRMNIIDLAGSERIRNDDKFNIAETGSINKSLLCLSEVIKKLGDHKSGYINYRDSKLTLLLKDSLGGNSKLAVIGNINPDCINETICTLRFLSEVKKITNTPHQNSEIIGNIEEIKKELTKLYDENQELKIKISLMKRNKVSFKAEKHDKSMFLHILDELKDIYSCFKGFKELITGILKTKYEERLRFYENFDKFYSNMEEFDEKKTNIGVKRVKIIEKDENGVLSE